MHSELIRVTTVTFMEAILFQLHGDTYDFGAPYTLRPPESVDSFPPNYGTPGYGMVTA